MPSWWITLKTCRVMRWFVQSRADLLGERHFQWIRPTKEIPIQAWFNSALTRRLLIFAGEGCEWNSRFHSAPRGESRVRVSWPGRVLFMLLYRHRVAAVKIAAILLPCQFPEIFLAVFTERSLTWWLLLMYICISHKSSYHISYLSTLSKAFPNNQDYPNSYNKATHVLCDWTDGGLLLSFVFWHRQKQKNPFMKRNKYQKTH